MKKLFLLITTLIVLAVNAQTTPIPDLNFENKLIALGIDSNGITGDILNSDAELVLNLDVSNSNIVSLDGIKAFINLASLNCSFNQLTTLSFVENVVLIDLDCSENNLTSLNILANDLLDILNCSFNQLNTLLVPLNPVITELNCTRNNLNTLNVSDILSLTKLDAGVNNLNTIDVLANPNLTRLSVYGNNINTINVTNNVALDYISVAGNQLNILDVSANINLANLSCFNNNLVALDLSHNTQLSRINCSGNLLTTLNMRNGNNLNIPTANFNASNNNLTCIKVNEVPFATANWTNIDAGVTLELYCEPFTLIPDANFENKLIALGIDTNGFTGDILNSDAAPVSFLIIESLNIADLTGIEAFVNLNSLNANQNVLTNVDLSQNLTLKNLNLNNNNINSIDITPNIDLRVVKISFNGIDTIDLTPLVLLKSLELVRTDLTTIDLSQNTLLKTLNIGQNFIQEFDLNVNTSLTQLTIDGGSAISNQARKIKDIYFEQCVNLKKIDLSSNLLTLLKLPDTNTLTNLNVETNNLVALDLTKNNNLEQLLCSVNNLDCLDISNKINFTELIATDNDLHYVNARNANLLNWATFNTIGNPDLSCINVDDANFATINFGATIDNTTSFSLDCYPTTIWNGANWDNGLPDNTKTAVINGNYDTLSEGNFIAFELLINNLGTLTVTDGMYVTSEYNLTNEGFLITEHQGSFKQKYNSSINTGSGTFSVSKTTNSLLDGDRFTYWSSPVEKDIIGLALNYAHQDEFYDFNKSTQLWRNLPNTTEMEPSIGYVSKPKSNSVFPLEAQAIFKGIPNNGIYQTDVIFNQGGINDDNNLIGNPYPSEINANFLFFENPNLSTLYFWTPNSAIVGNAYAGDDYATFSLAGGTAAVTGGSIKTKFIASCQGFFATTNAGGKITFKNYMRSTTFNDDFRTAEEEGKDDKIWIDMYNDDGLFNQALIAFLPNGTNDIDQSYDALKYNSGNAISFYSLGINQEQLVIQAKGLLNETETIPLGYHVGNETISTLKINIAQYENLENVDIFLKDNLLNLTHNFNNGVYEFSVSKTGNFNDRFELVLNRSALSVNQETLEEDLIVYNNSESEIGVKMKNTNNIKSFVAYDILGKELINLKPNKNDFIIKTNITQGTILFIEAELITGQILKKKFIKI